MTRPLIIAVCLFFVFLPWLVLIPILFDRMVAEYRERKRQGRGLDLDFIRLCYVTLLVAVALKGW
jgi:hypothetical protein